MKSIMTWASSESDTGSPQQVNVQRWIWLAIFALSLLSALSFFGTRLLADPDTYWHLAAGKWIIANREVPTTDPFSFSFLGSKWVTHEWLAEVSFAAAYEWLGWSGVVLLTALAVSAALTILLQFLLRYIEPLHAFAGTILAFLTLIQHLLARPHAMAWPLMVIWISQLVEAREANKAPTPWLLLVMLIWANLHASYILGIALAGAFGVEAILTEGAPRRAAKTWIPFLAITILTGFITPNGIDGLLYPLHVSGLTYSLSIISEWKAPEFRSFQPVEVWLAFVLFGLLYFGIRVPATRIAIFFGLAHLALTSARYAELLGLLAPIVLMPSVGPQLRAAIRPEVKPDISPRMMLTIVTICATLLLGSAIFLARGVEGERGQFLPKEAVRAAQSAGGSGPVFNSYNFGGYLIFSGIAPLIDGRADMYGDDFVRRYMKAYSGDARVLEKLIHEYKIRWAILEPSSPASLVLDGLPKWRKVYTDRIAVAYVLSE